jgi:choice-of-anchor B domain-containing protein
MLFFSYLAKVKKILLNLLFTIFTVSCSFGQISYNINLLGRWNGAPNSDTTHLFTQKYNEMWGYAQDGREYALLGGVAGYYFIEVTNPTHPVLRAYIPDLISSRCINRDLKTYSHYAYLAADNCANSSFIVADLKYLPDSVHIVYQSDTICTNIHSMYVENNRLYACSTRNPGGVTGFYKMAVYSLQNPERPQLISVLDGPFGHTHQVTVYNDTAYCSNGFDGLFVYDYKNPANPVELMRIVGYQYSGYNHSSWLSPDHKKIVFTDEVPHNLPLKIYDISDFNNPELLSHISSSTSKANKVPHIPYWKDNYIYCSYYTDGLRIFNVSDPRNPVEVGYYDTYPADNPDAEASYAGNWGVYPFLPSGRIIASDMQTGLYIFDVHQAVSVQQSPDIFTETQIYPNPATDFIQIQGSNYTAGNIRIQVMDTQGKILINEQEKVSNILSKQLNIQALPAGVYILTLTHEKGNSYHTKFVKK